MRYFNPRSPSRERQQNLLKTLIKIIYFNPRSPSRERRLKFHKYNHLLYFNPRSPSRERLIANKPQNSNSKFQSTLSKQRATADLARLVTTIPKFQATLSKQRATIKMGMFYPSYLRFQSTLSKQRATFTIVSDSII